MKHNTLNPVKYLTDTIFWAAMGFIYYVVILSCYRNLDNRTTLNSMIFLISLIVLSCTINMGITYYWRRTSASAFLASTIPFGIYAFLTSYRYLHAIYMYLLFGAGFICLLLLGYIILLRIKTRSKKTALLIKARKLYLGVRHVAAVTSIILVILLRCKTCFDGGLLSSSDDSRPYTAGEYTIADNIDTVLLLQEEEWCKLDPTERIDVLQCICNIEGSYLGIGEHVRIYAADLDDHVLGRYNSQSSSVQISINLLEEGSPKEVLDTVCHEMFHAAQHRYVALYESASNEYKQLYFLADAAVYDYEFKNYQSGLKTDNQSAYYNQVVERDARKYAAESVEDYYNRISEYLKEHTQATT